MSTDPVAGFKCPMCGRAEVHEHSGDEIAIYRNGIKAGLQSLGEPAAWMSSNSLGHVCSAAYRTNADDVPDSVRYNTLKLREERFPIPLYRLPPGVKL